MYNFDNESLHTAGVSGKDIEFYRNAHIPFNDAQGWHHILRIQAKVIENQNES